MFDLFDSCIAQLQIASRDINLLTRIPEGLSGTVLCHADKNRKKAIPWLQDGFAETRKRGPPQPKDGSFTIAEVKMLHAYNVEYGMCVNVWGSDKSALYCIVYHQDPGKLLYAYLVAGEL